MGAFTRGSAVGVVGGGVEEVFSRMMKGMRQSGAMLAVLAAQVAVVARMLTFRGYRWP